MSRTRVGVLRGGPSDEYEVSLRTGDEVLRALPEKYHPIDIFISRDGVWHMHGVPRLPEEIVHHADVFFNALHGSYGEDGKVQKLLDHHGVRYTGSRAVSSAVAMNKILAKQELLRYGMKTPLYRVVRRGHNIEEQALEIFRTMPQPVVIKPADSGSSIGITIARDYPSLLAGLCLALEVSEAALVEEYISGKEATCGVVDEFRGQNLYPLLPVEIIPQGRPFFDYEAKYGPHTKEICPGHFTSDEKRLIQGMAAEAHRLLGLRHYSRSDFIVHPRRGVYFLEVNTLPGLTAESLFPKSLHAIGTDLGSFLDHIITRALDK